MGTRPVAASGAAGRGYAALIVARGAAIGIALTLAGAAHGAAPDPMPEPLGHFPAATATIESGSRSHSFRVWIAATETRRNQGLMYVRSLPAGQGMLFLFDRPQAVSFWMKNTPLSLDLLFIAPDGRIIRIAEDATPGSEATIDSMGVVAAVLEVRGGTSRRLSLHAGDRVRHTAGAAD